MESQHGKNENETNKSNSFMNLFNVWVNTQMNNEREDKVFDNDKSMNAQALKMMLERFESLQILLPDRNPMYLYEKMKDYSYYQEGRNKLETWVDRELKKDMRKSKKAKSSAKEAFQEDAALPLHQAGKFENRDTSKIFPNQVTDNFNGNNNNNNYNMSANDEKENQIKTEITDDNNSNIISDPFNERLMLVQEMFPEKDGKQLYDELKQFSNDDKGDMKFQAWIDRELKQQMRNLKRIKAPSNKMGIDVADSVISSRTILKDMEKPVYGYYTVSSNNKSVSSLCEMPSSVNVASSSENLARVAIGNESYVDDPYVQEFEYNRKNSNQNGKIDYEYEVGPSVASGYYTNKYLETLEHSKFENAAESEAYIREIQGASEFVVKDVLNELLNMVVIDTKDKPLRIPTR